MNPYYRRIGTAVLRFGIDPRRIVASLRLLPAYVVDAIRVAYALKRNHSPFKLRFLPALSDRYVASGDAKGHYFHQDLWAARRIYERRPRRHVDVGSRVDGFIAHLLSFREVDVLDIRDLPSTIRGLRFLKADLMQPPDQYERSTDSLSCLHALEHFGLGRYGDPIAIDGWRKGFLHLSRMLEADGRLYLSAPIGPQSIEFNAHRIFDPRTIVNAGQELGLNLVAFSYIDDAGDFHEDCSITDASQCMYGCGCFEFVLAPQAA
jgi:hypothetical protein